MFTSFLALLALPALTLAVPTARSTERVDYTTWPYDTPSNGIANVACSNLPYATLGQIPGYPNIAGSHVVSGYGSPGCGTCWQITYEGRSVNVLAVDTYAPGWNLALPTMQNLLGSNSTNLPEVQATVVQVDASACGVH